MVSRTEPRIAVIGLGYVGLPVAVAFAERYDGTVGFDIDARKVQSLRDGRDPNREVDGERLHASGLTVSADPAILADANTYVVTVPTPIDQDKRPDLRPLLSACETVGPHLRPGDLVIFESTVWPGLTHEVCGPALERTSGLKAGTEFHLGYSPERINPGDTERTLERIVKVVSGDTPETLDRVAALYEPIIHAGLHRAPSIEVAEAAKVIENTQRDLNIALMNELAIIFDRIGISTRDVLEAARTKWNFLPFTPGLVGGHCIGVDPYYLTTKAEQLGYHPQVILAGRRINDGVPVFIASRVVKMLAERRISPIGALVTVLGVTFKENVPDVRNSKVPAMIQELREYGMTVTAFDPVADRDDAGRHLDIELARTIPSAAHVAILASPHREFLASPRVTLFEPLTDDGFIIDVKAALPRDPRVWTP